MTQFGINVDEERLEEIDKAVEEGGWNNRTEYVRTMVRVGESDFAALDPRSEREGGENEDESPVEISDKDLLAELREQCSKIDCEYASIDDVIQPFLEELDQELTERLLQMGFDENTGVKTNGKGGYKIEDGR